MQPAIKRSMRQALPLIILAAGCLSHLPPTGHKHMEIHWAYDYAAAQSEAQRLQRPILVVMAAGQIDGQC